MKTTAKFFVGTAIAITSLAFFVGIADAKRVKWSCVAPDPTTPWIQVCTGSTSRP